MVLLGHSFGGFLAACEYNLVQNKFWRNFKTKLVQTFCVIFHSLRTEIPIKIGTSDASIIDYNITLCTKNWCFYWFFSLVDPWGFDEVPDLQVCAFILNMIYKLIDYWSHLRISLCGNFLLHTPWDLWWDRFQWSELLDRLASGS